MKYPMENKTDCPLFDFLVIDLKYYNYYLYNNFEDALKKAKRLVVKYDMVYICEPILNNHTREYLAKPTFTLHKGGGIDYDKHAKLLLHIKFFMDAGEWKNPNKEWIELLKNKWEKK